MDSFFDIVALKVNGVIRQQNDTKYSCCKTTALIKANADISHAVPGSPLSAAKSRVHSFAVVKRTYCCSLSDSVSHSQTLVDIARE